MLREMIIEIECLTFIFMRSCSLIFSIFDVTSCLISHDCEIMEITWLHISRSNKFCISIVRQKWMQRELNYSALLCFCIHLLNASISKSDVVIIRKSGPILQLCPEDVKPVFLILYAAFWKKGWWYTVFVH